MIPLTNLTDMTFSAHNAHVFVCYYLAVANSWLGEAFFNTRFDSDDAIVRLLTVFRTTAIVIMSYGISQGSSQHFAAGYVSVRLILILQYVRALGANWSSLSLRKLCLGYITGFTISGILWFIAFFLEDDHTVQFVLFYLGLAVDFLTPFVLLAMNMLLVNVHPTHMPDRLASYTIVVISVMLTQDIDLTRNIDGRFTELCLLLAAIIPFCLMLLYTNVCGSPAGIDKFSVSAWERFRTYLYIYLHIPFTGCIIYTTLALQQITTCGHRGEGYHLTAAHAVIGTASTLILLGIHHFFVQGSTYSRGLTRIGVGALLLLLLIGGRSLTNEWYVGIIAFAMFLQAVLEYIFMREPSDDSLMSSFSSDHDDYQYMGDELPDSEPDLSGAFGASLSSASGLGASPGSPRDLSTSQPSRLTVDHTRHLGTNSSLAFAPGTPLSTRRYRVSLAENGLESGAEAKQTPVLCEVSGEQLQEAQAARICELEAAMQSMEALHASEMSEHRARISELEQELQSVNI